MEKKHLGFSVETLDIQKRQEWFPQPVAWVWTQLDRIGFPDGSSITVKSTIMIAETLSKSSAECAVWSQNQWQQVWRIEWEDMQTVSAFKAHDITAGKGIEVFEAVPEILQAVGQDVERVRTVALRVLTPSAYRENN